MEVLKTGNIGACRNVLYKGTRNNNEIVVKTGNVRNEVFILQHLSARKAHKHIVEFYGMVENGNGFIMPAAVTDLYALIEKEKKLSVKPATTCIVHILRGLLHMHNNNIVHRDIKLDNVLLFEDGCFKLCDMEFAHKVENANGYLTSFTGTTMYIAPEIHREKRYNAFQSDIWAVGICFFIILNGFPPFEVASPTDGCFMHVYEDNNDNNNKNSVSPTNAITNYYSRPSVNVTLEPILSTMINYTPSHRSCVYDILSTIYGMHRRHTTKCAVDEKKTDVSSVRRDELCKIKTDEMGVEN